MQSKRQTFSAEDIRCTSKSFRFLVGEFTNSPDMGTPFDFAHFLRPKIPRFSQFQRLSRLPERSRLTPIAGMNFGNGLRDKERGDQLRHNLRGVDLSTAGANPTMWAPVMLDGS